FNGTAWAGEVNLFNTAGKRVPVVVQRDGKTVRLELAPVKKDEYQQYVEAIKSSVRKIKAGKWTLRYINDWCGGSDAHDALEAQLGGALQDTDGLILDLRDGFGGNSLSDLDYFYRNPSGYPVFTSTTRNGKTTTDRMVYDKPVVALINDGS